METLLKMADLIPNIVAIYINVKGLNVSVKFV